MKTDPMIADDDRDQRRHQPGADRDADSPGGRRHHRGVEREPQRQMPGTPVAFRFRDCADRPLFDECSHVNSCDSGRCWAATDVVTISRQAGSVAGLFRNSKCLIERSALRSP